MDAENIIREAKEASSLEGDKKCQAQNKIYLKILEYFSRGGADLTLEEMTTLSRAALGMRTSPDPRALG